MRLTVHVVGPTMAAAESMAAMLQQHGLPARASDDALKLLDAARAELLGPLLIAEPSLTPPVLASLSDFVSHQPPWSDFPIIILNSPQPTTAGHALNIGSPICLEPPVHPETLVSTLRAAIRGRARQYDMRDALVARDSAFAELRAERDVLRNSEERFRLLIEKASVAINISDIDGHIFYGNPTLLRLVGYTAEEVERGLLRWDQLTPSEFAEADRLATEQLLSTGACDPYEKAYRARDGRLIPLLVGMTLIPSSSTDHPDLQVAVFLTDLTSQKKTEAALVQSEKLAAVGRMAASISHEINNPLESVINLLYLIGQEPGLSPAMIEYLSLADIELARVSQIATQTLRFHRQSTRPLLVNPRELVESVVALYQGRLLNSNIELRFRHRAAAPITCYEGEVRQVLNNLLGNAIDAMRFGGRLLLRTRPATSWSTGVPGIRITIADTGHGMAPEIRAHIFEAFYTTKGDSGTGLGLWISKGIIDKHRGHIAVRTCSQPPRAGTVFSLSLAPHDPS
jgi:PAS domain S-box-containing protein